MYRYAVDPGETTGLFGGMFDRLDSGMVGGVQLVAMQAEPFVVVGYLDRLITQGLVDWIVCERFQLTPQIKTTQLAAVEVIGALRYLCREHSVTFELQGRADRNRVGNDRLRALGWWPVGKPHAQDAARHLYVACARHNPQAVPVEELSTTVG